MWLDVYMATNTNRIGPNGPEHQISVQAGEVSPTGRLVIGHAGLTDLERWIPAARFNRQTTSGDSVVIRDSGGAWIGTVVVDGRMHNGESWVLVEIG